MANRSTLRLAAVLLVIGLLLSLGVGLLHPGQEDPNNHPAVFAEYARSTTWIGVHLGQFVGIAAIIAGMLALYAWLEVRSGTPGWVGRMGAVSAVVALGLDAVLQAVDGVALKRAVDAWANAPAAEQAARFASAESVRWLEEAVRSYQEIMLGVTFILLAIVIVQTARIPRPIGYLMGLSGILYLLLGWFAGTEGFSATHGAFQLPTYAVVLTWIVWLLVSAWTNRAAVKESTA